MYYTQIKPNKNCAPADGRKVRCVLVGECASCMVYTILYVFDGYLR